MITVVKVPSAVSLAENSVTFGFKSNNQVLSAGGKASLTLWFNHLDYVAGHQFKISFGGMEYVFTSALVPDDSGLQFAVASAGDTSAQWIVKIVGGLIANYYLEGLYDFTTTSNKVIITAKKVGADFTINAVNVSMVSLLPTHTAGADEFSRDSFKIFAQLNVSGLKYDDNRPVDSSGCAYFDFSEYLRPEMGNGFLFPESVNSLLILHPEAVKTFTVKYGEYYDEGNGAFVHRLRETSALRAVPGGVNVMTEGRYNSLGTSWFSQLCFYNKAQTWHPGKKLTHTDDMQKLYFLTHTVLTAIKLKVKLSYSLPNDGNIYFVVVTKATMTATIYQMWEICCGFDRLQLAIDALALPAGAAVYSYDVFLVNQDEKLIMDPFTFVMDTKVSMNKRLFIFRNSLGCYETFRAMGEQVREGDYTNQISNRFRQWNFTEKSPTTKKDYSFKNQKYSVNSGWLMKGEMEWVKEVYLSKEVYEIRNGILWPVVITSETLLKEKIKYLIML